MMMSLCYNLIHMEWGPREGCLGLHLRGQSQGFTKSPPALPAVHLCSAHTTQLATSPRC